MKKYFLIVFLFIMLITLFIFFKDKKPFIECTSLSYPQVSGQNIKISPGSKWIESGTGMEFVWVPYGCYSINMQHDICVNGFYMMTHEVTRSQFKKFINETGYVTRAERVGWSLLYKENKKKWIKEKGIYWDNPGFDNGNDHPVVHVSFADASSMGEFLTSKYEEDAVFRLPTEAEWEYACRSGNDCVSNAVDDICMYANVHDAVSYEQNHLDFQNHNCSDGYALTAPIKSFEPNAFGLYDTIGNVWEWVLDDYAKNSYSIYTKLNPIVSALFSWKGILRGGGWPSTPLGAQCSYRLPREKTRTNCDLGFRLVMIPVRSSWSHESLGDFSSTKSLMRNCPKNLYDGLLDVFN